MLNEDEICFYDANFIAAQPLDSSNILEYFRNSQFYDHGSINEIVRMQSQFTKLEISSNELNMAGFYYSVEYEKDNLFVIAKKESNGTSSSIIKLYYCMHGYIYVAPSLKKVLEARTIDGLWYLNESLNKYSEIKNLQWLITTKEEYDDSKEVKMGMQILHEYENNNFI